MKSWPPAQAHGALEEVFPGVFFVTGTMKTVLMEADWHFSRNMTVVRDGDALTLINTVRLDDAGLAALNALGKVTNVVRLGALHGLDDGFYVERYGAAYWAPAGMPAGDGPAPDHTLTPGGEMPFAGCSAFVFETPKLPEAILRIDRAGGILVACDALQNWVEPNAFFSDESRATMTQMGFFQPANVGPVWMQVTEPGAADFARLNDLSFRHALCGHGAPLRDTAGEDFRATFSRLFGV